MLSVVLPIRCERPTEYLLGRLEANLRLFGDHPEVECVVVDSASPAPFAGEIRRLCDRARCELVVDPAPQHPFAPGMARNAGAQRASGDHLLFYDVDLSCQEDFVPRVLDWIRGGHGPFEFLMIPCLYLTEAGTRRLGEVDGPVDLAPLADSLLAGENHLVALAAVSTSTVVVRRDHFLRIGGNRPEYRGHGCEDFDLLHRLASYSPIGAREDDYFVDERVRIPAAYRGFRKYLAYYSLPLLLDGLYTAHQWHPRPLRRGYFWRRRQNEALLQRFMREHDGGRRSATALGDASGASSPADRRAALPRPWEDESRDKLPPLPEYIREQMARRGLDPEKQPGLLRLKAGVAAARGTHRARFRKLVTRPRSFFADSRVPGLALLRHLFRH